MADDFLGKKMEDYQRGLRSNTYRPKMTPSGSRPGYWSIKFPPKIVFITGGTSPQGEAIIKALCNAGCKVSFYDDFKRKGEHIAQHHGAQYIHSETLSLSEAIHHIIEQRGNIDILINCNQQYSVEATRLFLATIHESRRIINVMTPSGLPEGVTKNRVEEILTMVSEPNVTANCVNASGPMDDVADTVVFLCSPTAGYLNRIEI